MAKYKSTNPKPLTRPVPKPILDEPSPTPVDKGEALKTMLLIAGLLLLIVIVGGALILVIMGRGPALVQPPQNGSTNHTTIPPQNNTTIPTNGTSNVTIPVCNDQCHLAAAISGNDYSECLLVKDATLAQDCALQLSGASLEACKSLTNGSQLDSCIRRFAIAGNDSSLCAFLPAALKDSCESLFDPCLSAQDARLCQALRDSSPEKCGTDSACIMNYSATKKDATPCAKLGEVESKACASAALNTDKCSDLPEDSLRNYCYELYAIYKDDPLVCTQINGDNVYSLDCVSHFAIIRHDLSICDKDSLSLNTLWACYINYSLGTRDTAGCIKIDARATTNKFTCVSEFAKKFGDPSACQMITDSLEQRGTCYQGAIIYSSQNLDWTTCSKIVSEKWLNSCYVESAKLTGNVSLCDLTSSDNYRTGCIDSYNLYQVQNAP